MRKNLRRQRPSEFVGVERIVLEDPSLSLAAKGLFAVVASWEEGASFPSDEVLAPLLNELKAAGYAEVDADGEVVVGWPGLSDDDEKPVERRPVPSPRRAMATGGAGWAYAISDEAANLVKIGCTQNVAQRLKALQTAHPSDLHVLWQGAGGGLLEEHLHTYFARRRMRGEWFDFTGADARKLIEKAARSFRGVPQ